MKYLLTGLVVLGLAYLVGAKTGAVPGPQWITGTQPTDPEDTPESENEPTARKVSARGKLVPAGGILYLSTDPTLLVTDIPDKLLETTYPVVEKDQELIRFDTEAIELKIDAADAQLSELKSLRDASLQVADQNIQLAKFAMEEADATDTTGDDSGSQVALLKDAVTAQEEVLSRLEANRDVFNDTKIETQRLELAKARLQLQQYRDEVERTQKSSRLKYEAAVSQKKQIAAEFAVKIGQIEQEQRGFELQLKKMKLLAPTAGTILEFGVREGEYAGQRPVVTMTDRSRMTCVAEVDGPSRRRIELGQTATVTSPSFPGKDGITGTVTEISPLIEEPRLSPLNPTAPKDREVFKVTITLDGDASEIASELINLPVEVVFQTEEASDFPADEAGEDDTGETEPADDE